MQYHHPTISTELVKKSRSAPKLNTIRHFVEVAKGDDKIACRLKDVPSIGFLICKTLSYEENSSSYPCKDVIKTELDNLEKLRGENIKIVTVDIHPIENVKCGETEDKTCSGFWNAGLIRQMVSLDMFVII